MSRSYEISYYLEEVLETAGKLNVQTGFVIGSTTKQTKNSYYYTTPIRNVGTMIIGGAIVYTERQAIEISKQVDGRVNYVLVDAEKKISHRDSDLGEIPNIERRVREQVRKSKLWLFKGNDISVDAVDTLISHLHKDYMTGIGGKKIAILGAGNIGSKLALKLVERGAHVFITRRDVQKLDKIVDAINVIKSQNTLAKVIGTTDNWEAAVGADILIGSTNGLPIITAEMIKNLNEQSVIIDVGKGTLFREATNYCQESGTVVYRLDVTAALSGLIHTLSLTDQIISNQAGRKKVNDIFIVSGGLLAYKGDVVVDNVKSPKQFYGISNGEGDFEENVPRERISAIEKMLSL